MYFTLMIIVFILGYVSIALEHNIKIDKAATALITGMLLWTIYIMGGSEILDLGHNSEWNEIIQTISHNKLTQSIIHFIGDNQLYKHLAETCSILFFLIGAMTIVEIIDRHQGFNIITKNITTKNKAKLLWIICILTFFLSAVLDNLTTTIVMVTLCRKLISDKINRWVFASMIIISANAGGVWSPIGDVTTIMLWIGGEVTTKNIVLKLIIPSLVAMIVPLILITHKMKKAETHRPLVSDSDIMHFSYKERLGILIVGICCLLFVPIFKTYTHLPPYVGMLFALGILWMITDVMHKKKSQFIKSEFAATNIIRKIDTSTILFFMGILTAVAALQSAGHLSILSKWLDTNIHNVYIINLVIGAISSIVDNVPLVAGAMGMYPIEPSTVTGYSHFFIQDGIFWEFLAYCAGTGGSMLIIGSAAGVAAMGLEKINFGWYFKNFTFISFIGYISGALVFLLIELI